jgi:hypothetical protein
LRNQNRAAGLIVGLGSKTVLTPLKWDVCFTPRKQTSVSYAADCNVIVCSDGARLADKPPAPAPFGWIAINRAQGKPLFSIGLGKLFHERGAAATSCAANRLRWSQPN